MDWGVLIARLQHFFGGNPAGWLDMPLALLESYAHMLPKLSAERSLRHVAEVAIGTGSMEKDAASEQLREWENATENARKAEKLTEDEKTNVLRGIGIQVD